MTNVCATDIVSDKGSTKKLLQTLEPQNYNNQTYTRYYILISYKYVCLTLVVNSN